MYIYRRDLAPLAICGPIPCLKEVTFGRLPSCGFNIGERDLLLLIS